MDLVFLNIRVGLFHNDHAITTANIAKAKQMLEEGGDWDRRNRLKVRWCAPIVVYLINWTFLGSRTNFSLGVRRLVRNVCEGLQALRQALP